MEIEREAKLLALAYQRDEAARRLAEFAKGELTLPEASVLIERWLVYSGLGSTRRMGGTSGTGRSSRATASSRSVTSGAEPRDTRPR